MPLYVYGGSSWKVVGPHSWVTRNERSGQRKPYDDVWLACAAAAAAACRRASSAARRLCLLDGGGLRGCLLLELGGQVGGRLRRALVLGDLGFHVALGGERGVERRLLLGPLRVGRGPELGQLRLELGQLGTARLQLPLLMPRDLARVGEHATALAERRPAGIELLADRADLVGEGRVLVRDGDQVAELGGDLVERVGREDDLEERRLAPLVGIAKMVLEQVLALGELGGAPVDRRRDVQAAWR